MIVKQGDVTLDTDQMTAHETGHGWMPRIYQSPCRQHVLLEMLGVSGGNKLHYASPSEVEFYARQWGLPGLLETREQPRPQ